MHRIQFRLRLDSEQRHLTAAADEALKWSAERRRAALAD